MADINMQQKISIKDSAVYQITSIYGGSTKKSKKELIKEIIIMEKGKFVT